MKKFAAILSLILGSWMLFDGIYLVCKGAFFRLDGLELWNFIFTKFSCNVYKLGLVFIVFGVLWLIVAYGFSMNRTWTYNLAIVVCVLTLWYVSIGTLLAIVILATILISRRRLNI